MAGRLRAAVALGVAFAVFGAAWYFLAPPQLGGKTSYAITFGTSMQPHFHHGDLVVLRERRTYAVGDVVAYRSQQLHATVLHRIVAVRGGHFTFKGDNNGFIDPERPTAADLVGSEWWHIPSAGNWLTSLHSPLNAAIAAFVIVMLLLVGGGGTVAHRRRRRNRAPNVAERRPARPAPSLGVTVAALGAGALCAGALLGALAFTKPLERSLVRANLYVQHGRFSYAADVGRGAAYQTTRLKTGDPVYLALLDRLPVAFAYSLHSSSSRGLAGTTSFEAVLGDDAGWSHTLVLAPAHPFAGGATTVRGVLDFPKIRRVIKEFERETGEHNTVYHLALAAHVAIHGTAAQRPLATTFAPSLPMNLDDLQLAVAPPADANAPANPFVTSAGGAGTYLQTAYVHAFGRGVTVARARRLAELLGVAGLLLAGLGGLVMLLGRRGHEVEGIRHRYEDWIDVLPDAQRAVPERRVASMEALARLAERYDRLILHEARGDGDAFLVEDDGIVYAYVVRALDRPLAVAR